MTFSNPHFAAEDGGKKRPFWSVMIPAYDPQERFFREAIESVLRQDPGPAQLQLEIIDDASPSVDVTKLARDIAGQRASVTRLKTNNGLAGCWNACIERARGEWIHILHQDDVVFTGYYESLRDSIEQFPSAGAAFCRHCLVDEHSTWTYLSQIESRAPTLLDDWYFKLTTGQRLQCPSIVVRRSVYQTVGGFRADLPYCLDWEMWARIAEAHAFVYTPTILAGYRSHPQSVTSQLSRTTATVVDQHRTFEELVLRLPPTRHGAARQLFANHLAPLLVQQSTQCYISGNYKSALELIECAQRLPIPRLERAELNRIARNSRVKLCLRAVGFLKKMPARDESRPT